VVANGHQRKGYARALADFGDNAISFLPAPPNGVIRLVGLLVHHDRERHLTGSPAEALRLVSPPPNLAERLAKLRGVLDESKFSRTKPPRG